MRETGSVESGASVSLALRREIVFMKKYDDLDGAESLRGDEQAAWMSLGDLPSMDLNAKGVGVVDRYELIEKLGQGGFGAVYGARDTEAGILVALKALPAEVSCDESEMKAIRKNFALVSRLHHPHIASVLHLHRVENPDARATSKMGIKNGDYLVVMEYAAGATLSAFRSAMPDEKMTLFQALEYARPIAAALDYAHAEKVLHRDIKPQNIIISREDGLRVKVLDFGLAAEIRSSMSRKSKDPQDSKSGTPNYMAPEQWRGKRQDGRADQYALAATIYELLSGEVAFKSAFDTGNHNIMRDVVVTETVEPLEELTKKQNAVLLRALSKEPDDRFGSCGDFLDALGGGRVSRKAAKPQRKSAIFNRKSAILLGLLVAGLLGLGVYTSHRASTAQAAQTTQETRVLLAAAQAALRSSDFAAATEQAQAVLRLNPNHSAAAELLLEIEKRAGERNARTIKIDTEMAVEKLEREITDRGQGFGEKLDSLKRELLIAQDAYASRSWGQAFTAFKGVEGICASIEAQQEVRGQALEVRDQMESQRRGAEAQSAESLAKAEWGKGVGAALVASQSFEKGNFEEASKGWRNAAKSFQGSEEIAIAISLYRKAKQEWSFATKEHKETQKEIQKYAPEEWAAAERSARLGEASESEPVLGKQHYVAALASYKKAVEKATPFLVPQMKWTATLNGKEVAATLKIGNQTFTLPTTIKLKKDQSYSSSVSHSGCKTVSSTLKADWNGLKEKRVALEEQTLPSDLVEFPGASTANSAQKRAVAQTSLPLEVKSRKTDIAFRLVPAGTFTMGSPSNEENRSSDETQHSVTISKPFYCGKFEVTQAQWKQVMGTSLSNFQGSENPVEQVSWDECQTFLQKLCELEGVPQGTYRLLTEAQWEYACRAGTAGKYAGDLNSMAWYRSNSERKTHPVGTKQANAWGMYDMHGNVWEWCNDWFGDYPSGSVTDPTGVSSASNRVYRGGSWDDDARYCRSANRSRRAPGHRSYYLGFRLMRTAPNLP